MSRVAEERMVSLALVGLLAAVPAPPPIEQAMPEITRSAIYLHEFGTELEPAIDALEKILDPGEALDFIDTAPLPAIALESLSGEDHLGLDRRGGLALFRLDSGDVAVGVVAIEDGPAALTAVGKALVRQGATAGKATEDGSTLYHLRAGMDVAAFTHGRFLYLVMPDTDVLPSDDGAMSPANVNVAEQARILRGRLDATIETNATFEKLVARVAPKGVELFVARPFGAESVVEGVLMSSTFDDKGTHLDGFFATAEDALQSTPTAVNALLSHAPAGASFFMSSHVQASELEKWIGKNQKLSERLSAFGLAPKVLAAAFSGDLQAAFYLDPELLLIDALSDSNRVGPLGTIVADVGVADPKFASALSSAWLKAHGRRVTKATVKKGSTRINALLEDQPVQLQISKDSMAVHAGPELKGRKNVDLLKSAREGLPAGAFGPSHLTLVADLAQLRRELQKPTSTDEDLSAFQRVVATMVAQLTALDRVALDLGPELGGARLSGELRYAPGAPNAGKDSHKQETRK